MATFQQWNPARTSFWPAVPSARRLNALTQTQSEVSFCLHPQRPTDNHLVQGDEEWGREAHELVLALGVRATHVLRNDVQVELAAAASSSCADQTLKEDGRTAHVLYVRYVVHHTHTSSDTSNGSPILTIS